jgi:hypothetical protein
MAIDAGSVFVNLFAKSDDSGFKDYERHLERVERKVKERDRFKAELGARFDNRAFNSYYRDLEKTRRAHDDVVKGNARLRTSFGTIWSRGGAAFAAAGGAYALVGAVKSVTSAYSESEASQKRVETALKNIGISYQAHGKQIDAVIQKQSKLAALDDEDLADSFAKIVGSTKDVNEALKLNGIAADVARGRQISLEAANRLVVRAYQGNAGALRRLGIDIQPVTKAQDDLREKTKHASKEQLDAAKAADKQATSQRAVGELQRRFAGQAEAYGKTQQGAIERLGVAWENLRETLGRKLAPTLTRVASGLAKFVDELSTGEGAGGRFAARVSGIAAALGRVFNFFERNRTALTALVAAITATASAWAGYRAVVLASAAATTIATGGLNLIIPALAAAATGIVIAYKRSETFRNVVGAAFTAVKRIVTGALDAILGGITTYLGAISTMVSAASHLPIVGKRFKGVADAIDGARDKIDGYRKSLRAAGTEQDRVSKAGNLIRSISDIRDEMGKTRKGSDAYKDAAERLRQKNRQLQGVLKDSPDAAQTARSAMRTVGTSARNAAGDVANALEDIGANTNNVLAGMGAKRLRLQIRRQSSHATRVGPLALAAGGWVGLPGQAGPDMVPAMLGEGEAVLNRHQQAIVEGLLGEGFLDRLFATVQRPHYLAKGGRAERQRFAAGGLAAPVASLANRLTRQFGLSITSTTGGQHAPGSFHYQGLAADLGGSSGAMNRAAAWLLSSGAYRSLLEGIHNPNLSVKNGQRVPPSFWGGAVWGQHANHIHIALRALGALGGGFGEIARRLVSGQPPLRTIAQGSLDQAVGAANSYLANNLGGGDITGQGLGSAGGQYNKPALAALWRGAGGPGSVANLMAAIALAESGGNPRAHNPSGATGLWQILGNPFPGDAYDPATNARMAVAKYRSQGLRAWEAYTNGSYRRYMTRGGLLRRFATGGRVGSTPRLIKSVRQATGTKPTPIAKLNALQVARIGDYDKLSGHLDDLGITYQQADRRYNLTDEVLVNDDGTLNQHGIDTRLREMDALIRIRERMVTTVQRMKTIAQRVVTTYRTIISRLTASLKHAKKKDRAGIQAQLTAYREDYGTWRDHAHTLGVQDVPNAILDLQELQKERGGIAGTQATASSGTDATTEASPSADVQAQLDQATANAARLQGELTASQRALTTFASSGDIGTGGYANAYTAAMVPAPVTQPQSVMVGGRSMQVPAGGMVVVNQNFESTIPYSPEQAKQVAGIAVSGMALQPTIQTTRASAGI